MTNLVEEDIVMMLGVDVSKDILENGTKQENGTYIWHMNITNYFHDECSLSIRLMYDNVYQNCL